MSLPEVLLVSCLLACAALAPATTVAKDRTTTKAVISSAGQLNMGLAQNYLQQNDLETALDRANEALRTDGKSGQVHAMLGLVYSRIGQKDKAADEFKRALELAPGDGSILNINGAWLCQQGQADAADAQFALALQDPFYKQPEQALFNAGNCAFQARQFAKAESYLRRALEKMPDEPSALLLLAKVEFAQGNFMDARAFIQRRDALGSSAEILDLAARIEDAAGDHRSAEHYRQRQHDEFPDATLSAGEGVKSP